MSPAGFWTGYQRDLMIHNNSDQGPWGGWREIHWQCSDDQAFDVRHVVEFASKNGWELMDSTFLSEDDMKPWGYGGVIQFPFTYSDFSEPRDFHLKFKRWISTDLMAYRFTTGWIAVEPGNASHTELNGYILFSSDKKQMTVYHLWGE
jgi:hypothetical protein